MIMYVKSKDTFATTYMDTAESWDVPIMASTNERGLLIVPLRNRKDFSGDYLYFDNHLFLIDESSPKDGNIEISVSDISNMFSRTVKYPDGPLPSMSYGDFITNAINSDYVNCEDIDYRFPYIHVNNMDSETIYEDIVLDDSRLYRLIDIIDIAREKGLRLDFYIQGHNQMYIDIYPGSGTPHNVIFDDGHSSLNEEDFSRLKTAKITVMQATGTQGQFNETVWYLSVDGDVTDTPPNQNNKLVIDGVEKERAKGNWEYLKIGNNEDPREKVEDKIKENIKSHKLEFFSDKKFYIWDNLRFFIDDRILNTRVTSVFLSSDDNRYLYKCGDLATTLTEKVQQKS